MKYLVDGAAIRSALELFLPFLLLILSGAAFAQAPETPAVPNPDAILEQARLLQAQWFTSLRVFARNLFWLLATIQFIWAMALLVLRNSDFQDAFGTLVKQIMFIGFGLALLINAPEWMGAIVNSFTQAGEVASGLSGTNQLAPGEMFQIGTRIAVTMMSQIGAWDLVTNLGAVVLTALCALLILISLAAVTLQVIVIKFELFIVQTAGILMLGFAGSRWTFQYAERYITYAISVGVRLLITYLVIAIGLTMIRTFTAAIAIANPVNATWVILEMTAFCLVFCMIVWMLPKLAGALMSGALQSNGNELVSGMAAMGGVAATAALGAGSLAGLGAAAATGGSLGQVARASQLVPGGAAGSGTTSGPMPFGAVSPPGGFASAGPGGTPPTGGPGVSPPGTGSVSGRSGAASPPGSASGRPAGPATGATDRQGHGPRPGGQSQDPQSQQPSGHSQSHDQTMSELSSEGSSANGTGQPNSGGQSDSSGAGRAAGAPASAIGPMGFGAAPPPPDEDRKPSSGTTALVAIGTSMAAAGATSGAVRTLMDGQGDGGQRAAGQLARAVGPSSNGAGARPAGPPPAPTGGNPANDLGSPDSSVTGVGPGTAPAPTGVNPADGMSSLDNSVMGVGPGTAPAPTGVNPADGLSSPDGSVMGVVGPETAPAPTGSDPADGLSSRANMAGPGAAGALGASISAAGAVSGAVRTLMDGQGDGGQHAAGAFARAAGPLSSSGSNVAGSLAPSIPAATPGIVGQHASMPAGWHAGSLTSSSGGPGISGVSPAGAPSISPNAVSSSMPAAPIVEDASNQITGVEGLRSESLAPHIPAAAPGTDGQHAGMTAGQHAGSLTSSGGPGVAGVSPAGAPGIPAEPVVGGLGGASAQATGVEGLGSSESFAPSIPAAAPGTAGWHAGMPAGQHAGNSTGSIGGSVSSGVLSPAAPIEGGGASAQVTGVENLGNSGSRVAGASLAGAPGIPAAPGIGGQHAGMPAAQHAGSPTGSASGVASPAVSPSMPAAPIVEGASNQVTGVEGLRSESLAPGIPAATPGIGGQHAGMPAAQHEGLGSESLAPRIPAAAPGTDGQHADMPAGQHAESPTGSASSLGGSGGHGVAGTSLAGAPSITAPGVDGQHAGNPTDIPAAPIAGGGASAQVTGVESLGSSGPSASAVASSSPPAPPGIDGWHAGMPAAQHAESSALAVTPSIPTPAPVIESLSTSPAVTPSLPAASVVGGPKPLAGATSAPASDDGSYQDDSRRIAVDERMSAMKAKIQQNKGKS